MDEPAKLTDVAIVCIYRGVVVMCEKIIIASLI